MNILTWYAPSNNGAFQKVTEVGYFSELLAKKPTFSFSFTNMSYNEQNGDFSIDGIPMSESQKQEVLNEINAFVVPFVWFKNIKTMEITASYQQEVKALTNAQAYELSSFTKQENEARAWLANNTVNTPFIDGLLIARYLGETKAELVDKIILNADAYATAYSQTLGKFQKISKKIAAATTKDELSMLVWA